MCRCSRVGERKVDSLNSNEIFRRSHALREEAPARVLGGQQAVGCVGTRRPARHARRAAAHNPDDDEDVRHAAPGRATRAETQQARMGPRVPGSLYRNVFSRL
jgi:hypothetical protein